MLKPEVRIRSQARRLRRKRLRTHNLADLAQENPAAFTRAWNGGVGARNQTPCPVGYRAGCELDTVSGCIDCGRKDLLESIGDRAIASEMAGTMAAVNETQMQALAWLPNNGGRGCKRTETFKRRKAIEVMDTPLGKPKAHRPREMRKQLYGHVHAIDQVPRQLARRPLLMIREP